MDYWRLAVASPLVLHLKRILIELNLIIYGWIWRQ